MITVAKISHLSAERLLKTAGDLFIYDGDYEAALLFIEQTLAITPHNTRALILKGDILYCLNRDNEALTALDAALMLNPASVEAHLSRAGVLDAFGRLREAVTACLLAHSAMGPEHDYLLSSLYEQHILLLTRLKKFAQARALLRRAEKTMPAKDYQSLRASYAPIIDAMSQARKKDHAGRNASHLELVSANAQSLLASTIEQSD